MGRKNNRTCAGKWVVVWTMTHFPVFMEDTEGHPSLFDDEDEAIAAAEATTAAKAFAYTALELA